MQLRRDGKETGNCWGWRDAALLPAHFPGWKVELEPKQQKIGESEHCIKNPRLAQPLGIAAANGLSSTLHALKNNFLSLLFGQSSVCCSLVQTVKAWNILERMTKSNNPQTFPVPSDLA